jgi:hypothetical protein
MKTIEVRDGYVFIYYDEQNEVNALIALMHEVAEVCKREKIRKILADLSHMQGEPSPIDRFTLGVSAVWILRGVSKSALVYRNVESNRFAETVAVNRGLPSLVTHDIETAKRWLGVE